MTHKRFASPILTDVGKESMLDLVPLAGARLEMTNRYDKTGFVGELLQFRIGLEVVVFYN